MLTALLLTIWMVGIYLVGKSFDEFAREDSAFSMYCKGSPFYVAAIALPFVFLWPLTLVFFLLGRLFNEKSLSECTRAPEPPHFESEHAMPQTSGQAYIVYGRENPPCPYCTAAKNLLTIKDLPFEYVDVKEAGLSPDALSEIAGQPVRTVPIIMRGSECIGGFVDLEKHLAGTK